jgi:hypothetical protein
MTLFQFSVVCSWKIVSSAQPMLSKLEVGTEALPTCAQYCWWLLATVPVPVLGPSLGFIGPADEALGKASQ